MRFIANNFYIIPLFLVLLLSVIIITVVILAEKFVDRDAALNSMIILGRIRPEQTVVFDFGCTSCSHSLYFKSLHSVAIGHKLHKQEGEIVKNQYTNKKGAARVVSLVARNHESPKKTQWTRDSIQYRDELFYGRSRRQSNGDENANTNNNNEDILKIYNNFNDYGDVEAIGKIIRQEQDHEEAHSQTQRLPTDPTPKKLKHHVPATVFLRLRSVEEANEVAPILFKNLRPGSRIVSLNHHFEKYQASLALVFDSSSENSTNDFHHHHEFEDLEEDNEEINQQEELYEEDMPQPRAIFVYVVSHEQSSAVPHDIGKFSQFSISSLSHEQMIHTELLKNAGISDYELFYYRFLTSKNVLMMKNTEDGRHRHFEHPSTKRTFFHGSISSHEVIEDVNGRFDHCLITVGTKDLALHFIRFQHPTQMKEDVGEFDFRLIKRKVTTIDEERSGKGRRRSGAEKIKNRNDDEDYNIHHTHHEEDQYLTEWVSNEGGKFERFTIPREELEVRVPFHLSIEFRFLKQEKPHQSSRVEDL